MFLVFELTIIQHWFKWWLGAGQAAGHYLNQWWLVYWRICASLGLYEFNVGKHVAMLQTYTIHSAKPWLDTSQWVWKRHEPSTMCRCHNRVKSILRYRCASYSLFEKRWWHVYITILLAVGEVYIKYTLMTKMYINKRWQSLLQNIFSWTWEKKRTPRPIPPYYACKYYYHLFFYPYFARTQVYNMEPLAQRLLRSILDDDWCTAIILCLRCLQNDELENDAQSLT